MVAEKVFAVIAESTRRDILAALAQESKAVGQLVDELGVSQPTVSKHLRVLREAGVVTMRAQGQKRFYGINTEPLTLVSLWLESFGAGAPDGASTSSAAARVSASGAQPGKVDYGVETALPAALSELVPKAALLPEREERGQQIVRPSVSAAAVNRQSSHAANVLAAEAAAGADIAAGAQTAKNTVNGTGATPSQSSLIAVPSSSAQVGVVQSSEADGGVQGQISRSVGRAANKAADLLANLPALPTFRRRKD